MFSKKSRRQSGDPINAGSMADIAFLLLIFFLVTATILEDQGIYVKLPPWTPEQPITSLPDRNVLSVLVNAQDELLVEGERTAIDKLKAIAIEFISNPGAADDKPATPKNAIISLINDRGTSYQTYLSVYNEIKAAYSQLWDKEAEYRFGTSYALLASSQQRLIRQDIPLVISEAEPVEYILE